MLKLTKKIYRIFRPKRFKYSNYIKVGEVLEKLNTQYCILRMNDHFPNYFTYSDIDIITEYPKQLTKEISQIIKPLKLKYEIVRTDSFIHIDIYKPNSSVLDLKFDIILNFQKYKSITNHKELYKAILSTKKTKRIKNFDFAVPDNSFDMLIRFIEFYEFKEIRPQKIKHLHYINSKQFNKNELTKLINNYCNIQKEEINQYLTTS